MKTSASFTVGLLVGAWLVILLLPKDKCTNYVQHIQESKVESKIKMDAGCYIYGEPIDCPKDGSVAHDVDSTTQEISVKEMCHACIIKCYDNLRKDCDTVCAVIDCKADVGPMDGGIIFGNPPTGIGG